MKITATFLTLSVLLLSCTGSRHYTKLGTKQETAGLINEAAESFYTALQKKRTNVDAQIGMRKTGQLKLNSMLNDFAKAKNFGTKKDAVYSYQKAVAYQERISRVGVTLDVAEFYQQDYLSVKNAYMVDLYEEGTTLLEEQKYQEAEQRFNEIRALDPNFKDSKELGDIAYLEPLYVEAKSSFDAGLYRKAYNNCDKIIARKPEYKDAKQLKQDALKKGTFTVALLPFENSTNVQGLDSKVNAYTLEALTNINDPFLRIVDREHMQAILQEQKLQLSGVMDDATAVKVGELVGAQALLTGVVLGYETNGGKLRTTNRDAYESYKVKHTNPEDGVVSFETKYKKTRYTEYYNSNNCSVSFQYKLISLGTAEIMKTEIIEKNNKDEVLYARYDGDANSLLPAAANGPNLNNADRNALQSMLKGRQELRSMGELTNELFDSVSKQMSKEIGSVVAGIVK